jgi:hypothetical protein
LLHDCCDWGGGGGSARGFVVSRIWQCQCRGNANAKMQPAMKSEPCTQPISLMPNYTTLCQKRYALCQTFPPRMIKDILPIPSAHSVLTLLLKSLRRRRRRGREVSHKSVRSSEHNGFGELWVNI